MINNVHERILRVILDEHLRDFKCLLENNKGICSHRKNIQSHMIEMFKIKKELASLIMDTVSERRNEPDNLLNFQEYLTERKRIVHYDIETLSYWSPQLWSLLPENIKDTEGISTILKQVKKYMQ